MRTAKTSCLPSSQRLASAKSREAFPGQLAELDYVCPFSYLPKLRCFIRLPDSSSYSYLCQLRLSSLASFALIDAVRDEQLLAYAPDLDNPCTITISKPNLITSAESTDIGFKRIQAQSLSRTLFVPYQLHHSCILPGFRAAGQGIGAIPATPR
jgi:hypothetical protein